ncbi:hypothetical protein E1B28_007157 [Marasmius oreades]|uniref:Uncharacterized protein n=1 Tax=Marasmius oreades TaxID=181124 RepID=A0A9P7UT48_9AGAR|nr:uncharacterized protein E1B28_007157 [Marasmius oreades]KAG7093482.1 hypothetical protein E1B28_007157 [Marasmius oreades]
MFVPRTASLSPSAEDLRLRETIFNAISYLSVISCTIIILIAILLSLHSLSKQKTDRVSFRIMVYALCTSVVYSITMYLVNRVHGQTACRVTGSSTVFGLHLSSFLFFCIGLNLQLVMIHGIDGAKAEKYYVWGSLSLALVLGVLTYVSNQLTYDSKVGCYYYDPNPVRGFWWRVREWLPDYLQIAVRFQRSRYFTQMGMQNIWSFLTMAGELVTFCSVVIYMIRVKVFSPGPSLAATVPGSQRLSASHQYRKPLGPRQYRNIVLRISLYPLSSLATSGLAAVGTVSRPTQAINTRSDWIAVSTFRAVFLSRGTVYALVACADPAITQGLKVLYRHYTRRQTSSLSPSTQIDIAPPLASHSSSNAAADLELEGIPDPKNESLRRACLRESRSSVTLPKTAVTLPSREGTHSGTRFNCTAGTGVGSETQIIESDGVQHHYSYPYLRQL